ncbi:MAG: ribonuclease P protein component 4 [Candidatus Aenigmatarchaeota archaeon]
MSRRKHRRIARNRIRVLFEEAEKAALNEEFGRADRYVELARKIGMRHNVSLPSEYKRRVCKNCYSYLHPSKTCSVRLKNGLLVTRCFQCGTINRYGYKRDPKE